MGLVVHMYLVLSTHVLSLDYVLVTVYKLHLSCYTSGKHQCLGELHSKNKQKVVVHGTGDTAQECHNHAACNGLKYLQIMTKKR